MRFRTSWAVVATTALLLGAGVGGLGARADAAVHDRDVADVGHLPHPAHIVVIVEENRSYADIVHSPLAAYLRSLMRSGASFTHSYAITHPSEPNYLALFSGWTHGVRSDHSCPQRFRGPNLANQLRRAGKPFTAYVDALPYRGFRGCFSGGTDGYTSIVAPWTDFTDVPASVARPISAFPRNYARLPPLCFVSPSLRHDMHERVSSIADGDQWLQQHLAQYVTWARAHNSLLVVTWDEDDHTAHNQIPTIIVGAHVRHGRYTEHMTHYRLLRTIEALEGLPPLADAAHTRAVTDIWRV